MVSLIELGRETPPEIAVKYGLVGRSPAERMLIVDSAMQRVGGDEDQAARLLRKTLLLIRASPIWGKSLFVGEENELESPDRIAGAIGLVHSMPEAEYNRRLVDIAFKGMLGNHCDIALYAKLVADLGGKGGEELLMSRLRGIAAETFMFRQAGGEYYEQMAGRSVWSWEPELLWARLDHLRWFKSEMTGKAKWYAEISGVNLQIPDVNREIGRVFRVILAENANP